VNAPLWVAAPVVILVAVATRADVRSRKIPNLLTGPALLLGVVAHGVLGGPAEAGNAVVGALVAGALLFPGWMFRFMGAGDVKLMAAVGAWLGYPASLLAALVSLVAGGVLAVAVAVRKGVLTQAFRNTAGLAGALLARSKGSSSPPLVTTGVRFPFAPAVLVGAVFALWRLH
jgi:prepilin peptidase CpaA